MVNASDDEDDPHIHGWLEILSPSAKAFPFAETALGEQDGGQVSPVVRNARRVLSVTGLESVTFPTRRRDALRRRKQRADPGRVLPCLQLLFPADGFCAGRPRFIIRHGPGAVMARGPGFASLVFVESANQVVGGTDVQPAGCFAFQDVHEIHGLTSDLRGGLPPVALNEVKSEGWRALPDSNQ